MANWESIANRLEKAAGPDRVLDNLLAFHLTGARFWIAEWGENGEKRPPIADELCERVETPAPPHYTASVDDALALIEAALPEWDWGICKDDQEIEAELMQPGASGKRRACYGHVPLNSSPALALCLALVRAQLEKVRRGQ